MAAQDTIASGKAALGAPATVRPEGARTVRAGFIPLVDASVLIVAGALLTGPAAATMRFGPLQISGNLQSQNIVRTPDAQTYQFIQNRNVARIQLVYDWLQGGKLMDRYNIPFIRDSKRGICGAHRCYLGRPKSAVLQLLTMGGLGIWVLIDLVLIVFGELRDGDGRRLRELI